MANSSVTGIFPLGKFHRKVPLRLFPPGIFSPNEAWLCELYHWHEPVPTGVLNPNASEASYKPKQRSYKKSNLNFFFSGGFWSGRFCRGDFIREPVTHVIDLAYIWVLTITNVQVFLILLSFWFKQSNIHDFFFLALLNFWFK